LGFNQAVTSRLPTGTVTFLFTDVEGSTRLLQELGDEYADILAEHRRALREAFARHGGVEVETEGDAFFVAFAKASDALAAASEAREVLAGGPIRVRMGLHTGEPTSTDEGYVGIDVHRAARIAAAGHGGQILLSQATRDLAGADRLRDLGLHRLKDLPAPERLYQLGDDEFPPLKSLDQTNLPVQPTPFVGREPELAEVHALLDGHRIVTLTVPGGSGKTRLALQAAAESVERYGDGIWFVSLAAVRDPQLIEPTIARVIGGPDDLHEFLTGKRTLLVLDNLEQLLPDAADIVARLDAHILATSRSRLNIAAEQEFPVPTLPIGDAATLFTQRARQLDPRFEPDSAVIQIAERLDGLPLALELAAARVKVLTPGQILQRLGRSLDLLTSGAHDAPARQRTLRGTWNGAIACSLDTSSGCSHSWPCSAGASNSRRWRASAPPTLTSWSRWSTRACYGAPRTAASSCSERSRSSRSRSYVIFGTRRRCGVATTTTSSVSRKSSTPVSGCRGCVT
jgi:class 3 adenylate cyclase